MKRAIFHFVKGSQRLVAPGDIPVDELWWVRAEEVSAQCDMLCQETSRYRCSQTADELSSASVKGFVYLGMNGQK
jgi:hypothetical protein